MALPAETVGRFVLHSRVPRRGVGELWAAVDRRTGSQVFLRLFDVANRVARVRLSHVSHQLAALSHQALPAIHECSDDDRRVWWVLDDIGERTLAEPIGDGTLPPLDRAVATLAAAFEAVVHARRHGVSGLLFTPDYLWVSGGGALFRVAGPPVTRAELEALWTPPDSRLLPYMAPEVLDGAEPDARSDVFTAGVVVYEILTRRRPFEAAFSADFIARIRHGPPPARPALPEGAERRLQEILDRALATSPLSRFADLDALAARLADASLLEALRSARTVEPSLHGSGATSSDVTAPIVVYESGTPEVTPAPVSPVDALPVFDDNVQFTVYRPQRVTPGEWHTMLVFAHLDALPDDASPEQPDPVEEVRRRANAVLGDSDTHSPQTTDSSQPVPRAGLVTVSVSADGVEFNPPSRSFRWNEPVHREEFRLRADARRAGQTVRGRVTVFLGSIILADLALKLRVASVASEDPPPAERQSVPMYRHIFASYSHDDAPVVDEFSRYARAVGDRYLRDVIDLRSGERWSRGLEELIRKADVFQLFWSWNALRSPYVRQEWQYALSLQRPAFIRPVYWDDPLPEHGDLPPPALRSLHFERIVPVAAVGTDRGLEAAPPTSVSARRADDGHPPRSSRRQDEAPVAPNDSPTGVQWDRPRMHPAEEPGSCEQTDRRAESLPHARHSGAAAGPARSAGWTAIVRNGRVLGTVAASVVVIVLLGPAAMHLLQTQGAPMEVPETVGTAGEREPGKRRAGSAAPSQPGRGDDARRAAGGTTATVLTGHLHERGSASHRVDLTAGQTYTIDLTCAVDCTDVDVRLYDSRDALVSEDLALPDVPRISVTPQRSGTFRIDVHMRACAVEPCAYSIFVANGDP